MITLGSTVKDSITGFTGIASNRMTHLHGCVHIGITPTSLRDGKPIEAEGFDEQRIKVLNEAPPLPAKPAYPLGSKVVDRISGFEGIATSHVEYLYGNSAVAVTPATLSEGKLIGPIWFEVQRIAVVEERAPAVSPATSARTGGPAAPLPAVHR